MTQKIQTNEQVALMLKELQDEIIDTSHELGAEDIFSSTIQAIDGRIDCYASIEEHVDGLPAYLQPEFELPEGVEHDGTVIYLLSNNILSASDYESRPKLIGYPFVPKRAAEAIRHLKSLPDSIWCERLIINAGDPDHSAEYDNKLGGGALSVSKFGECDYQFSNNWSNASFSVNVNKSSPAILHEGRAWMIFDESVVSFELNGKRINDALSGLSECDIDYSTDVPAQVVDIAVKLGLPIHWHQNNPVHGA